MLLRRFCLPLAKVPVRAGAKVQTALSILLINYQKFLYSSSINHDVVSSQLPTSSLSYDVP
jgi:hypothetical protein